MKRLTLALSVGTLLGSIAYASPTQGDLKPSIYMGGNITRTYQADDLKRTYGILSMSVGEIWVLNLPDTVTDVITTRDGVLQFSRRGNRVVVGAIASSGTYPIVVQTDDSLYFFQAQLSPSKGGGIHNIVVEASPPANEQEPQSGAAAQPAPLRTSQLRIPAQVLPISPVVSSVQAPTPQSAPRQAEALPAVSSLPSAANVFSPPSVSVDYRAMTDGRSTMLYYRIQNTGSSALTYDEANLTLRTSSGPVAATPARRAQVVAPGQAVYGQMSVPQTSSPITALWAGRTSDGQPVPAQAATVSVQTIN